jgi:hypothetical protein
LPAVTFAVGRVDVCVVRRYCELMERSDED